MPVALEDKILSATEVRQQFFRLLQEVRQGCNIIIHQPRHEDVTIVPRAYVAGLLRMLEELTAQIESLELSTDPQVTHVIERSEEDIRAGRTVELGDAKRILKGRRSSHGNR